MGLRFRKSIKMGPVRVNFSKSGVGYSVGGSGFRATKKAGGGYRTTASIPGTGISYVKDYSEKKKTPSTGGDTMPNKSSGGKKPGKGKLVAGGLAALCVVGAIAGGGGDKEDKTPDASVQASTSISIPSAFASAPLPGGAEISDTSAAGDGSAPDASAAASSVGAVSEPDPGKAQQPAAEPEPAKDPEPVAEPEPVKEPEPQPDPEPAAPPAAASQPSEPPAAKEPEPEPAPEPVAQTYIGNSNTMKFHKPSCSSVEDIAADNKVTLDSRDSAISKGYQPCKRCNP